MVIAAITSCTNTSNPQVMVGAGLVATPAVERGLAAKPWVKTSLAPGSRVVMDYLERAGLLEPLEKLGFYLVGFGCTTCIGNSGPLLPGVSEAVRAADLSVAAVLSGNRNFEGRIHPDVRMNYLASPPLVVAFALAGTMDIDLATEPLGTGSDGSPVFLADALALVDRGGRDRPGGARVRKCSASATPRSSRATSAGSRSRSPEAGPSRGRTSPPTCCGRPSSTGCRSSRTRSATFDDARVLAVLGDCVTTDHISPAGSIGPDTPAGRYLTEHGVARGDFNSYGARRGNHEVMMRGTFANIRLRNRSPPGPRAGSRVHLPDGEQMTIYDAAMRYAEEGIPLVVLAGKEYGTGSSRDWAAKGTLLLGVRAVLAESFERIHRSNLVGMGVLPLQFPAGESVESLGLTGEERFAIAGLEALNRGEVPKELTVVARRDDGVSVEVAGARTDRHPHGGRVLPPRRHPSLRPAAAGELGVRGA